VTDTPQMVLRHTEIARSVIAILRHGYGIDGDADAAVRRLAAERGARGEVVMWAVLWHVARTAVQLGMRLDRSITPRNATPAHKSVVVWTSALIYHAERDMETAAFDQFAGNILTDADMPGEILRRLLTITVAQVDPRRAATALTEMDRRTQDCAASARAAVHNAG
jgi:hypothetical protein